MRYKALRLKTYEEYLEEEKPNKEICCSSCNHSHKTKEWLENKGCCPHCNHYGGSVCNWLF